MENENKIEHFVSRKELFSDTSLSTFSPLKHSHVSRKHSVSGTIYKRGDTDGYKDTSDMHSIKDRIVGIYSLLRLK